MNESIQNQLQAIVDQVVRPVFASRARKRLMREELLAHVATVFEAELESLGDDQAAVEATRRRFGVLEEVQSELQASVPPLERWFLAPERETLMSRWYWMAAIFAVLVGPGVVLPALAKHREDGILLLWPLFLGGLITLAGIAAVGYGVARLIAPHQK